MELDELHLGVLQPNFFGVLMLSRVKLCSPSPKTNQNYDLTVFQKSHKTCARYHLYIYIHILFGGLEDVWIFSPWR